MNKLMPKTIILTILFLVLYILSFIFLDKSVALYSKTLVGTTLYHIGIYASLLANGNLWRSLLPLLLIAVIIYDYLYGATTASKTILYILLSVIVAITLGGALKFLLGRYRPLMFYSKDLYGFHFLTSNWAMTSTPSGHAYRIFALMGSLAMACRRWRWLFLIVAITVGISRIIVHAHYPSDVLFGAYIGLLAAVWTRWYMYHKR